MSEVVADQNYYFDADGNVTTDESKGERWLARQGAAVLPEHQKALQAFQDTAKSGKVARQAEKPAATEEAAPDEDTADEKAAKAPANKKAKPSKNKGAK